MAVPKSAPTAPIASAVDSRHQTDQQLAHPHILAHGSHHAPHSAANQQVVTLSLETIGRVTASMSATNLGGHLGQRCPSNDLPMALEGPLDLLLLTVDPHPESVLPSLSLLAHNVRTAPTEVSSLLEAGSADVAIVDARTGSGRRPRPVPAAGHHGDVGSGGGGRQRGRPGRGQRGVGTR
mgnify:CR=1 FL=1